MKAQLDDKILYNCLKSIASHPCRQLQITPDMWVACLYVRGVGHVRVYGRELGRFGDLRRVAEELPWDCPPGS